MKWKKIEAMPDEHEQDQRAECEPLEAPPVERERERDAAQHEHAEPGRGGGVDDDFRARDLRVVRDQRRDADAFHERERVEPQQRNRRIAAHAVHDEDHEQADENGDHADAVTTRRGRCTPPKR